MIESPITGLFIYKFMKLLPGEFPVNMDERT